MNPKGCHQGIDLAGANAADVRLHHDAIGGLIHAGRGSRIEGRQLPVHSYTFGEACGKGIIRSMSPTSVARFLGR